jgi:PAS domain S-box-containing protein
MLPYALESPDDLAEAPSSVWKRLSAVGAWLALTISAVTGYGWLLGISRLLRLWNGAPAIAADTSLLLFCCGLGLLGLQARRRCLPLVMGTAVFMVTGARLLLGKNPGFLFSVHRFFPHWTMRVLSLPDVSIMTMVLPVALIFFLFACALLYVSSPAAHRLFPGFWGVAAVGAALAGIGCLGLLALVEDLHAASGQRHFLAQMSPWTAFGSMVLGVSLCLLFAARHRPARHHLSIALAVLSLVALFVLRSGVDYTVFVNEDAASQTRAQTLNAYTQLKLVQGLVEALQEAETGQRGFLLTRDVQYIAAYGDGRRAVYAHLEEIRRFLPPSEESKRLAQAVASQMGELAQTVALEYRGEHERAVALVRANLGLRLSGDIRRSSDKIIQRLRTDFGSLLQANKQSTGAVKRAIWSSIWVSVLLVSAAVVLVAIEFKRWTDEQRRLRQNKATLETRVAERTQELAQEIEQRRTAERALRESQTALNIALHFAQTATWTWDPHADFITWNGPVDKIFGKPPNSYVDFFASIHPEDKEKVDRLVQDSITAGSQYQAEFRIVLPDASVRWIFGGGGALFDESGQVIHMSGVNFDITQRKRMELALRESELQFRYLADAIPQIVWKAQPDGCIDYYNQRWQEISGLPVSSAGEENWKSVLHPDDVESCAARWQQCVRSGEPLEMEQRFWDCRCQQYRWHLTRAIPVRNRAGQIVRWFGACTDIHEQKVAKELLEDEVQTRTEDLRQALREKDVLFKEVHHRVKNNLQVISSLLRMQADTLPDSAAAAALQESRQRVFSMSLIHERLYGGQQMHELDFGDYAQALVNELLFSSTRSGAVRTQVKCSPILLNINQAIPCGLILNELVTNALKYAYPNGEGEIAVEVGESAGGRVSLTVADRGVGLPPGFNPKRSKTLGLSIVEILARQLGGKLRVESAGGAQFTIEFPREPAEVKTPSAA